MATLAFDGTIGRKDIPLLVGTVYQTPENPEGLQPPEVQARIDERLSRADGFVQNLKSGGYDAFSHMFGSLLVFLSHRASSEFKLEAANRFAGNLAEALAEAAQTSEFQNDPKEGIISVLKEVFGEERGIAENFTLHTLPQGETPLTRTPLAAEELASVIGESLEGHDISAVNWHALAADLSAAVQDLRPPPVPEPKQDFKPVAEGEKPPGVAEAPAEPEKPEAPAEETAGELEELSPKDRAAIEKMKKTIADRIAADRAGRPVKPAEQAGPAKTLPPGYRLGEPLKIDEVNRPPHQAAFVHHAVPTVTMSFWKNADGSYNDRSRIDGGAPKIFWRREDAVAFVRDMNQIAIDMGADPAKYPDPESLSDEELKVSYIGDNFTIESIYGPHQNFVGLTEQDANRARGIDMAHSTYYLITTADGDEHIVHRRNIPPEFLVGDSNELRDVPPGPAGTAAAAQPGLSTAATPGGPQP